MYKFPTCTPTDNINRPYNPVCTSFRLVHQKKTNQSINYAGIYTTHKIKIPFFICRDNALCLSKKLLTPSHREATLTTPCACPKNFSLVHFCKANPPVALCEPLW